MTYDGKTITADIAISVVETLNKPWKNDTQPEIVH